MSRMPETSTLLRFLVSGGAGFVLFYAAANVIRMISGFNEGLSAFLGTLVAIGPTFLLQRSFTFRVKSKPVERLGGYLVLQLASAAVIGAAASLLSKTALPAYVVFVIAGGVGVVFSFAVQSLLIFRK